MLIFIAPKSYAVQSQGQSGTTLYDYYFPSVAVLLHGEGSNAGTVINDEAGGTWTVSGVTTSTAQKKFGNSSLLFTGVAASYISAPASTSYALGTSDFTIECWIYPTTLSNAINEIVDNRTGATASAFSWAINQGGNGLLWYDGPNNVSYVDAYQFLPNQWYHIAVCRVSGVIYQFVNGICISSRTLATNYGSSQPLKIGQSMASGTYGLVGYLDEFRLTNGVGRYVSTFNIKSAFPTDATDPYWNNVVLRMTFDGSNGSTTFTDVKGHVFSASNATLSTTKSKFGASSGYFNGTSAVITTPAVSDFKISSGAFTFELWVYVTASGNNTICTAGTPGVAAWYMFQIGSNNSLGMNVGGGSWAWVSSYSSPASVVPLNAWTHIAFTARNGTLSMLVNGASVYTTAFVPPSGVSGTLYIGTYFNNYNNDGSWFRGYMDDLRFTNGMTRYSVVMPPKLNDITDSSSMLTTVHLLTNGLAGANNTVFVDGSANNSVLTRTGNVQQGSSSPYDDNGWSISLPGNVSYITTPTNAGFAFGAGNFTVEYWVKLSTLVNQNMLSDYRNGSTAGFYWCDFIDGTGHYGVYLNNVTVYTSTTTIKPGVWTHIATCKTGGRTYIYLNGVLDGSFADTNTYIAPPTTWGLGISQWTGQQTTGYSFNGLLSEHRVVKGTAVYVAAFTPPTTRLTAITGTTLLIGMDNRIKDNSGNGYPISLVGTPTVQPMCPLTRVSSNWVAPGGTSVHSTGASNYLTTPDNAAFALGASDFTIEAWIFVADYSNYHFICQKGVNATSGWTLYLQTGTGYLMFGANTTNGGSGGYQGPAVPAGRWSHVAVSRAGTILRCFINGVATQYTASSSENLTTTNILYVCGRSYDALSLEGYVTDLRIVKGTAIYTANFAVPTTPLTSITGTSLLLGASNPMVDSSPNAVSMTSNGVTTVATTPYDVKKGGSVYVDNAVSSYLSTPYVTSQFDWWTSDFTIEAWVYLPSYTGFGTNNRSALICNGSASTNSDYWSFGPGLTGKLTFYYYNGAANQIDSNAVIPLGSWNHIAMTKSASGIMLFVNGVLDRTIAISGTPQSSSASPLLIGVNSGSIFKGYFTDLRVVKGTAIYTGTFTPPVAPLTVITGTQLLVQGMNGGMYDNMGRLNLLSTNVTTTTNTKYAATSMNFNGSTAWLRAPNMGCALGAGDFSISAWIYPTSVSSGYQCITDLRNVAPSATGVSFYLNNAALEAYTNATVLNGGALVANTWSHVAMTRVSGILALWVNGAMVASVANTVAYTDIGSNITVGCSEGPTQWFSGWIEDFLIKSGTAMLPATTYDGSMWSAFSVPTAAFQDQNSIDYSWDQTNMALNFEQVVADYKGQSAFVPTGTVSLSTTQKYSGSQALYFDGTATQDLTGVHLTGVQDFTIEGWFYYTGPISDAAYHYMWNVISGAASFWLRLTDSGYSHVLQFCLGVDPTNIITFSGVTKTTLLNVWSHLVVMRKNGTIYCYLNGVLKGSATNAISVVSTTTLTLGVNTLPFVGYIDEFRVTSSARYPSGSNFTVPSSPLVSYVPNTSTLDPFWNNVSCALRMNGTDGGNTITDDRGQSITNTGVVTKTSVVQFGMSSAYFNGSSNLSVPANASVSGTGDFTFEMWINPTSFGSGYKVLLANDTTSGVSIGLNSTGTIFFGRSLVGIDGTTSNTVTFGVWNHVALSRTNGVTKMFINGVQGFSGANVTSYVSGPIRIGVDGGGSSFPYTGYIDDLRITRGVGRYTNTFVPSTNEIPVSGMADVYGIMTSLSMRMNGTSGGTTFTDDVGHSIAVSSGSVSLSATQSRYGGTSCFLNQGSLLCTGTDIGAFGTSDFTIELWVYPVGAPAGGAGGTFWFAGTVTNAIVVGYNTATTWGIAPSGGSWLVTSATLPTIGTWSHIAIVRVLGTITLYLNGVALASVASNTTNFVGSNTYIGHPTTANSFSGYMDDIRLTKYARYLSAFTPPQGEILYGLPSYDQAYDPYWAYVCTAMRFNGADGGTTFADDKSNTWVPYGAPITKTAIKRFGVSSVYFNGASALTLATTSSINFGTNDFTIEAWIYPTTLGGEFFVYNNYGGTPGATFNFTINADGSCLWWRNPAGNLGSGAGITSAAGVISANTWTHWAAVKKAGVWRLYINGQMVGTTYTDDIGTWTTTYGLRIGAGDDTTTGFNPAYYFTGYLDDLRITNGVGRYTANFLPRASEILTTN